MFSSASEILERNKESIFTEFQNHNHKGGLPYIKKNCVDYFYDIIKDIVPDGIQTVKVLSLEASVIDITSEGIGKVASVHYIARLSVNDEIEFVDEIWNFVYNGWNWKLAGMEQPA
jgi:hypothetical protein